MPKSLEATGVEAPYKHLTRWLVRSKYSKAKSKPAKRFIHDEPLTYVGNTEKGLQMNESLNVFSPTPESIAAVLMVEIDGEILLTDAGLFAVAGSMANDTDIEAGTRGRCMVGILRALAVARAGGLPEQVEQTVLRAFAEGINPADGTEGGMALADVCAWVTLLVGTGRMEDLIAGRSAH